MRELWRLFWTTAGAVAALAPALAAPLGAEEESDDHGWSNVAELTWVATGGNAEAETLGFRDTLTRETGAAKFTLEAGGLRAENTTITRLAVGEPGAFRIEESAKTELTAESYYLRGRYDRTLGEGFFWYAGLGWERNEFAGVADRYVAGSGVGHLWFDGDEGHFRTDYGVTYTDQEDVSGLGVSFAGVRLRSDYLRRITPNTSYQNLLLVDLNADETTDYRADMINSLAVAMNERLALKVSLQLLYDNLPSLVEVPLVGADGVASGETVLAALDELDTVFNVALVVNY